VETVEKSLSNIEGGKVIIACSGGADSIVLLDITRIHGDIAIVVAHVNHNLRPTSDRDEEIVKKYCKKYDIKVEIISPDIKKEAKKTKTTIEECARNIRKEWFETLRKKHKADSILTAHHADDQAETLLYRITK
jgi:tRNA(Ile)-lysidine synthase